MEEKWANMRIWGVKKGQISKTADLWGVSICRGHEKRSKEGTGVNQRQGHGWQRLFHACGSDSCPLWFDPADKLLKLKLLKNVKVSEYTELHSLLAPVRMPSATKQRWFRKFEEHKNEFEVFHQISVQTSPIHGGLKGSAANILVPDTSAHVLGSGGVLPGQGCFGSKKENSRILGRGSWRYVWSVYMSKCEHTKRAYLKKNLVGHTNAIQQ